MDDSILGFPLSGIVPQPHDLPNLVQQLVLGIGNDGFPSLANYAWYWDNSSQMRCNVRRGRFVLHLGGLFDRLES